MTTVYKGPTLSISKEIHEQKYRNVGESFDDCVNRLASTLSDTDDHRRALSDIIGNMRFMPAGRVQAAIGAPKRVTPWNCLAGETKLVTKEYGLVELAAVVGQEVTILDGECNWVKVPIIEHGVKETYKVTLKSGLREFIIKATEDHDWLLNDYSIPQTKDLVKGDSVCINYPTVYPISEDYKKGVIHGLIYGDGDEDKKDHGFRLRVCSHHESLYPSLKDYPHSYPPSYNGDPIFYFFGKNNQGNFKTLPHIYPSLSVDYLYGFISGWFAADGCVSKTSDVTICGDKTEYDWLQKYGCIAGINVMGFTKLNPITNFGKRKKESLNIRISRNTLEEGFFLIEQHKRRFKSLENCNWVVKSVEYFGFEPVYCPSVPTTNSFLGEHGLHLRNCFVSGVISDDFNDIMEKAKEAGHTMRLGGGIGYDFSTLRPRGSLIKSLGSYSSGPISFMDIFDSVCGTIASAGHRRGAQMGVLRVDHPDIEEFVHAKRNSDKLTRFNISVGITDSFMEAVKEGKDFNLKFHNKIVKTVDARALWGSMMRNTWNWAEPGILFIDRINEWNNLWYCETITTTNPCVPGSTLILTDQGYEPIESLVDKEVNIWNGDKWSPVKPFSTGINETVEVHLSNNSVLRCTPNHEFILAVKYSGKEVKVKAEDLKQGDMLAKFEMPVIEVGEEYATDAYSQGFYSGDGTRGQDRSLLYWPKFCCEDRLKGKIYINNNDPERKSWKHGPMLDKDFVPINGSLNYRLNWLAGILDSDGTQTNDKNGSGFQITSVNQGFLEDLKLMLTTLGCQTKVVSGNSEGMKQMPDKRGGTKEYWCRNTYRLLIGNTDSHHLYKIGLRTTRIKFEEREPQRDARQFVKVVSVRDTEPCETFCFTDKLDGRGTFNGIVTGQCGEQPLPPYGACLLGSFNLVKYVTTDRTFDYKSFQSDIGHIVRAMDNIIDIGVYPLPQQETEGKSKRRMGLGVTGLANALEYLNLGYGSPAFISEMSNVLEVLRDTAYNTSAELAKEKGSFPLYNKKFLKGKFIETLPEYIKDNIKKYGIRNSHLLSIAPTGTISLSADNISSGIEPVFTHSYTRSILINEGLRHEDVTDFGYREWGVKGRTANELSPEDHVNVLINAQKYVDSSCSKTCNVGDSVSWERFQNIYMMAYDGGAKGCTTYRSAGKRKGIFNVKPESSEKEYVDDEDAIEVCTISPTTGQPTCS